MILNFPRIAIVHDTLIQRGGAERVVLAISKAFPHADVITSIFVPEQTYPEFQNSNVVQLMPKHAELLPLSVLTLILPYVFKRANLQNYDMVIASTSSSAHFSSFKHPNVIAYAHNTPRWLYQVEDFEFGLSLTFKAIASLLRPHYIGIDKDAAARVKIYLGNSIGTCQRINNHYSKSAILLNPPLMLTESSIKQVDSVEGDYILNVSRSRGYKNVQKVIEVALNLKQNLVIVGQDKKFEKQGVPGQIRVVNGISDPELANIYRNSKLLLCAAVEDFGLTSIEANYFGVPVVAPAEGGYLETIIHGKTGILAQSSSVEDLIDATRYALQKNFLQSELKEHASLFSFEEFKERLLRLLISINDEKDFVIE